MARLLLIAAVLIGLAPAALAEPFKVEVVLAPKESMKLAFKDGSKHFVLLVRRKGKAKGDGPFDGASVVEFGWHDIIPGVAGDPHGYLVVTTAGGDIAYLKWSVRAVFLSKPDGAPRLADHGFWELASGTGAFAGKRGVGTLTIKPASKTDRLFTLEGEITPAPGA